MGLVDPQALKLCGGLFGLDTRDRDVVEAAVTSGVRRADRLYVLVLC